MKTRKILSAVLALVMVMALTVPAFAAENLSDVIWMTSPPEKDEMGMENVESINGGGVDGCLFDQGLARYDYYRGLEHWGIFDKTGKMIVPAKYRGGVGHLPDGRILADDYNGSDLFDQAGNRIGSVDFSLENAFSEGLAVARLGSSGKRGFVDEKLDVVIPFEYDEAFPFSDGLALVKKYDEQHNAQYSLIDKAGKIVIPSELLPYEEIKDFSNGVAVAGKGNYPETKYGLINSKGEIILPVEYDEIVITSDGVVRVAIDLKDGYQTETTVKFSTVLYGLADLSGKIVLPVEYDRIEDFSNGVAVVEKGSYPEEKYGIVNTKGKFILPVEYDDIQKFDSGVFAAKKDGKTKIVDANGTTVVPYEILQNYYVGGAYENLVIVREDSSYMPCGVIDSTGKVIIPLEYDYILGISDDLILVERDGKCGYFDTTGKAVTPVEFDSTAYHGSWNGSSAPGSWQLETYKFYMYPGMEGKYACVKKDGKYGLMSRSGKLVVPAIYDEVGYFADEWVAVRMGEEGEYDYDSGTWVGRTAKWGIVDTNGNTVLPIEYDGVYVYRDAVVVEQDGRQGFMLRNNSSTEPVEPTEPSKPTEPEKPTEPSKPTEPEKPTEPAKPAEPEKPTEPAKPAAGTYTAKQWDTWGHIALNNYGSYAAWPGLYAANGYKGISVGMTITLPEKIGSFTRLAPQTLAEGEKLYTVKAGDTLGQIAVSEYGSFMMYKAIFERNSDRLKNVNTIYDGQTLVLPVKPAK